MESVLKTSEKWPLSSWHGALINIFKNYKTIADCIIKMLIAFSLKIKQS